MHHQGETIHTSDAPPPPVRAPSGHGAAGGSEGRAVEFGAWGVLLLCAAVAVGLRFAPAYAPFAITDATFGALRSADLAALRTLGVGDAIDRAVEVAGRTELSERVALEARAREAGSSGYQHLLSAVQAAGMRRFEALSRSEQSRIRDRSLVQFVLEEGARAGRVELPAGMDAMAFAAESPDVATATRLGKPSLAAEDAARLGDRTAADRALQDDLALLEIAVTAAEAGERIYADVRRSLVSAGNDAFRALDYRRQQEIREASFSDFVHREGFAAAPDDVKQALGSVEVLFDSALADALRQRLGLSSLEPADRVRLSGFDSAALGAADSPATRAFVTAQGTDLVRRALHDYFAQARCVDRGRARTGEGVFDLYLRGPAAERKLCVRDEHELLLTVESRWNREAHRWELQSIDNWGALVGMPPSPEAPSTPANDLPTDSEVSP